MPFFTPPVVDGVPRADPTVREPGHRLLRFYGSHPQGRAVWRDSSGVWHESESPTVDDENDAVVFYGGGRTHEITAQEEADLIAAGYAANITP